MHTLLVAPAVIILPELRAGEMLPQYRMKSPSYASSSYDPPSIHQPLAQYNSIYIIYS